MSKIRTFSGSGTHDDGVQLGASGEKIGFAGKAPVSVPVLADNSTGATAAAALAAGLGAGIISFPLELASIANGDVVVAFVPGYKFKLLKTTFVTNKPATTGSKAATLTPKITGVAVTGGVLSLTSATVTPIGTLVAGTSVTALNTGSATDSITLTASAVTAFVEGNGTVQMLVQNMDTADAVATVVSRLTSEGLLSAT